MFTRLPWLVYAIVPVGLLACTAAQADDVAAKAPGAEETVKKVPLEELTRQLDADRFADRQAASRQLEEMGREAIPALQAAALGDSRESRMRALDVLKKNFQSNNAETKEAARQALQKIADSDRPAAATAAEILNPKPVVQPQPAVPFGAPGQIQIRVQAAGGRRVNVRNANGVRDIEVQEQDGRKIKIHDDPNKGIKVEVTEKRDGKEVTKKYEAKNADELKKQHPEAHKIYEQYRNQPGGIQIQAIQIQGGGLPIPIQPRIFPARRFQDRQKVADRLKKAQQQLEEATRQIKDLHQKGQQTEAIEKSLKQLEETRKQLEEAQKNLWP